MTGVVSQPLMWVDVGAKGDAKHQHGSASSTWLFHY